MSTASSTRPNLPVGDPARHLAAAEVARRLAARPASQRDAGRVTLLVSRRADGGRDLPTRVRLTVEEGMPGDSWARRLPLNPDAQLAVINDDVAATIANGQPLTHFGNNLVVSLDLSEANLPVGSTLRVGGATVAVTPKPHLGCAQYRDRFGAEALAHVNDPARRHERLRGVYWKVVEPGEVAVGDAVVVTERA